MNELQATVKRTQPRYVTLDEDIFDALDPYTLKVYLSLRFEGDYSKECSGVKKSIAFLMESSGIKRRQFFKSLNILEGLGLIKREDNLGYISNYLVSRTLYYFKNEPVNNIDGGVHHTHGGVHDMHGGVHQVHTDQESIHKSRSKDSCESNDSPPPKVKETKNKPLPLQEFIAIWNEIAEKTGNPKQGKEKRSLAEIKRNLKVIHENWNIPLSPDNFRTWLENAIMNEFYMLTKPGFLKSLAVITRWNHFEEAFNVN